MLQAQLIQELVDVIREMKELIHLRLGEVLAWLPASVAVVVVPVQKVVPSRNCKYY